MRLLTINDTYGDDVRELVVLVMEVDKVADEVTDMEIDKYTDMVMNITNEEFFSMTLAKIITNTCGATWYLNL